MGAGLGAILTTPSVSLSVVKDLIRWSKLVKSSKCPPDGTRDELVWFDRCVAGTEPPGEETGIVLPVDTPTPWLSLT